MERFRKIGKTADAHSDGIWGLSEVSDSQRTDIGDFVTGGGDGLLKTWRLRKPDSTETDQRPNEIESGPLRLAGTFKQHALPIVHLAVARNAPVAASTSLDGVVKIWDISNPSIDPKSMQQTGVTDSWDVAISADGKRIVTGGANGAIQVIDANMKVVDATFSISSSNANTKESKERPMVLSVALNHDDTRVALGAHDGTVTVWDVETAKAVCSNMTRHGGPVRSLSFLPEEPHTLLTASDDQLINVHDTSSQNITGTCRGHAGMVLSVRGSPTGKYIISGSSDCTLRVWDRVMRESIYEHKGHAESIWGVCYTAQGSRIVTSSDDSSIGLYDSSNADISA